MATEVTEREAREVAEAAREDDWKLPSFGKELFLGRLKLDLIHPQPKLDPAAVEKGEAFLARLRTFLEEHVDALAIEREDHIPDTVVDGLKDLGALGMKVPESYGGLGLSQVYYNRALMLVGSAHSSLSTLLSAHQSIGVAEPLQLFGSEEQKRKWLPLVSSTHISAFLLTEPDVGSDPARLASTATPTEDGTGYTLNGRKLWATNGAIADVVVVMAEVPKDEAAGHRGGITAFVVPCDDDGVTVEHQLLHGAARDRELGDALRRRLRALRERHRGRGAGPQGRADDAQHRPPGAPGDLRRRDQVGDEDRARMVRGTGAVGPAGRQARRGRPEGRVHRRQRLRPGGDGRARQPPGRRQEGTTSGSRPRSRSCGRLRARLEGDRRRSCRSAAGAATRRPSR